MINSQTTSNYEQALKANKEKKYTKAIELFLLETLNEPSNLKDVYFHLSLSFFRKKLFQEACEVLLLRSNKNFTFLETLEEENSELRTKLYKDFCQSNSKNIEMWRVFAKKAEEYKCWSVIAYANKELIARDENCSSEEYFSLATSLLYQKNYKEAYKYLKEETLDNIKKYRRYIGLEEKVILYEDNEHVYDVYLVIDNDAHFDSYRHVWVTDDMDSFSKTIKSTNSIIIQRDSDLYKRYLARSKYIITNRELPEYYQRKKAQNFLLVNNKNKNPFILVQEIFFGNGKIVTEIKLDNYLNELYAKAVTLFEENEYAFALKKFLELKQKAVDVNNSFPVGYYIQESKFQMDKENKPINELLEYKHYRFKAENFAGILYLLTLASKESNQTVGWQNLSQAYSEIINDIKKNNTQNIRAISDQGFLEKISMLSESLIDELESELLPYSVWFVFANLFIFARLYSKYQLAREKALESILKRKNSNSIDILRYQINALIESNRVEEYKSLRKNLLDNKDINELELLGSTELYVNQYQSSVEFYKPFYNEDEKKFAKYIENKSIAIVGPVDSKLNLGEEIDSHDIVLRFNYKGVNKSLAQSSGIKTNISFYISEILIPNRIECSKVDSMNELDWIIYDKAHKKESICFLGVNSNLRAGYFSADPSKNPYLKGTPSGIQRAILDLLRFNIGTIKVYNTNLFLENNYEKNYKSRGSLGADYFNFIWHDPLSNFIFLKRLKENNIIETDTELANILILTSKEYIEKLSLQYGKCYSEGNLK